ncbi:MAG: Asp/Glu/hydantoin racemase [Acidobacteriota bacterium]
MLADGYRNQTHEQGVDNIADFNKESFIYLGDKANMPYGKYDSEGKSDFLRELIIKDVQFLLNRKYYNSPSDREPARSKQQVKVIVVACNTATAFGLEIIKRSLKQWNLDIGVLGIIGAGSKAAVDSFGKNQKRYSIGVFATEGTCATKGYPKAIKKQFVSRFKNDDIVISQQAGFGLAAAIDGDINYIDLNAKEIRGKELYYGPGLNHPKYPIDLSLWDQYNFLQGDQLLLKKDKDGNITEIELNSVENYIRYHVTHLVNKMTPKLKRRKLNSVILGCTHYPFYEKEIADHFYFLRKLNPEYTKIISPDLAIIDPSEALADELYQYLVKHGLMNQNGNKKHKFFISVPNGDLEDNIIDKNGRFPFFYKYGRNINSGLMFVKRVPFSYKWINRDIIKRIQIKMPDVFDHIFGSYEKRETVE